MRLLLCNRTLLLIILSLLVTLDTIYALTARHNVSVCDDDRCTEEGYVCVVLPFVDNAQPTCFDCLRFVKTCKTGNEIPGCADFCNKWDDLGDNSSKNKVEYPIYVLIFSVAFLVIVGGTVWLLYSNKKSNKPRSSSRYADNEREPLLPSSTDNRHPSVNQAFLDSISSSSGEVSVQGCSDAGTRPLSPVSYQKVTGHSEAVTSCCEESYTRESDLESSASGEFFSSCHSTIDKKM